MPTKTEQAIELMKVTGMSAYAAAKRVGISPVAVYNKLNDTTPRCPHCGQKIRKGSKPPKSHKEPSKPPKQVEDLLG